MDNTTIIIIIILCNIIILASNIYIFYRTKKYIYVTLCCMPREKALSNSDAKKKCHVTFEKSDEVFRESRAFVYLNKKPPT